jgi:1-acyl-sn-glycerol-3-phosphate acyltransferase
MRYIVKLLQIIYCVYAILMFVVIMFIVIPIVIIASFFGRIQGGNFIYRVCSWWGDVWFFLIGIVHKNIYESPHDKRKQYVFVINHISYLDIPVLVKSIRQPIRVLGKSETAKIPIFGYIYRKAVVMVERGNQNDRIKSVRALKSVLRKDISIVIFPEGTFNETGHPLKDFYDGAFRIAIEAQIPIKPILFVDTYDRMHYRSIFSLNPGRSRSVFLHEIPVEGLRLSDMNMLKQKVYHIMDHKLRLYGGSPGKWLSGSDNLIEGNEGADSAYVGAGKR